MNSPWSARCSALLVASSFALVACGGASSSALFDLTASGSGTPDASSPVPDPIPDAGKPPLDAALPVVDAQGPAAVDAYVPPPVDANPPPVDANPPPVDANPPPPGQRTIACGNEPACDLATDVCCAYDSGGGNNSWSYRCESSSSCQQGQGLSMTCVTAANCTALGQTGDECCLSGDPNIGQAQVACMPMGQCAGSVLCDKKDPGACPLFMPMCNVNNSPLPPYGVCGP